MSRFIRNAGTTATSGVDLSTCEINTSRSITANCFIGSGKTLCDTRWDLLCSYTPNSIQNVGSSVQYELPTHCYSEFYVRVCNYSVCSTPSYISFGNSICVCSCCGQFSICCPQFAFSSTATGYAYPCTSSTPVCISVYGCCTTTCPQTLGFELYLKKTITCGICYDFYNLSSTNPCALYGAQRGTVASESGMCTVWSSETACSSRFTRFLISSSCPITLLSNFCYSLYGLK